MAQTLHVWQYKVGPDEYLPFPDAASDELEAEYQAWTSRGRPIPPVSLKSGKYTYDVDFHSMAQRNQSTQRSRELQRRESRMSVALRESQQQLQRLQIRDPPNRREVADLTTQLATLEGLLESKKAALRDEKDKAARSHNNAVELDQRANQSDIQAQRLQQLVVQLQGQLDQKAAEMSRFGADLARERAAAKQSENTMNMTFQKRFTEIEQREIALKADLKANMDELDSVKAQLQERVSSEEQAEKQTHIQWQFWNHLEKWQPYEETMNEDLERLHSEWCAAGQPNTTSLLADRYHIHFEEKWQENVKHGTGRRRQIRRFEIASASQPGILRKALTQMQEERERASELESKIKELDQDKNKLQEALAEQKEGNARLKDSVASSMSDHATRTSQLAQRVASIEAEKEELETTTRQLANKNASTEADKQKLEGDCKALQEALTSVKNVNMQLGKDVLLKQEAAAKAKAVNESIVHELQKKAATDEKEVADMKSNLRGSQQKCNAVEKQIADLKKSCVPPADHTALKRAFAALEQKVDSERKAGSHLKEKAEQRLRESQTETKQMQQKMQQMQEECEIALQQKVQRIKQVEMQKNAALIELDEVKEQKVALQKRLDRTAGEENTLKTVAMKPRAVSVGPKRASAEVPENRALQREFEKLKEQLAQKDKQLLKVTALHLTKRHRERYQEIGTKTLSEQLQQKNEEFLHITKPDEHTVKMMEKSVSKRDKMLACSPSFLTWFCDLPHEATCSLHVPLLPDSVDYTLIHEAFLNSLKPHRVSYHSEEWADKPQLQVDSIVMLPMSSKMLKAYKSERERIGKRGSLNELPIKLGDGPTPLGGDVSNEVFLFHGTPWDAIPSICESGFDCHFAGTNKGVMFGKGVYFSPYASKCNLYTDKDKDGKHCMILARVLLGSCLPKLRKCTEVETMGKYDSIAAVPKELGGGVDYAEVCIYQNTQAMPAFKIIYSHKAACQCSQCRYEQESQRLQ